MTESTLPVRCVSLSNTARLLHGELRSAFPGTQFSVRLLRGTGAGWIHVAWTNGPHLPEVRAIADAYQGAHGGARTTRVYHVEHFGATASGQIERIRYSTRGICTHRTIRSCRGGSAVRRWGQWLSALAGRALRAPIGHPHRWA